MLGNNPNIIKKIVEIGKWLKTVHKPWINFLSACTLKLYFR